MSFEPRLDFILDGANYIHANPVPEHSGAVRRFPYREEPKVIAQVPLQDGGSVEVHGYATHYGQEWVSIAWTDNRFMHLVCWVQAASVRRPAEGEWHGRHVDF